MLDSYRDLIDELLDTPGILRDLMAGEPGQNPDGRRAVEWLRLRDHATISRLNEVLRSDDVVLKPLAEEPTDDPAEPTDELLAGFDHGRGDLVSLLMNLTIRDWGRTAIGEDGGETNVAEIVEDHVDFDEEIVRTVRALAPEASAGDA